MFGNLGITGSSKSTLERTFKNAFSQGLPLDRAWFPAARAKYNPRVGAERMDPETQANYRARLEAIAAEFRLRLTSNPDTREPVSPDSAIGRLTRLDAAPDTFLCKTCFMSLQPS
jgi:hypothetical protein